MKKYAAKVKSSPIPFLNDNAFDGSARGGPHPIKSKTRPAGKRQQNGELAHRGRKFCRSTEPSLPFVVRAGRCLLLAVSRL